MQFLIGDGVYEFTDPFFGFACHAEAYDSSDQYSRKRRPRPSCFIYLVFWVNLVVLSRDERGWLNKNGE